MSDLANLRDHDGVVHLQSEESEPKMPVTVCEEVESNRGYGMTIDTLYDYEELSMTRVPVTCMRCLGIPARARRRRWLG